MGVGGGPSWWVSDKLLGDTNSDDSWTLRNHSLLGSFAPSEPYSGTQASAHTCPGPITLSHALVPPMPLAEYSGAHSAASTVPLGCSPLALGLAGDHFSVISATPSTEAPDYYLDGRK